jgi:hypothetical protein
VVAPDVKRETDVAGQFTDEKIVVTVSQPFNPASLPKFSKTSEGFLNLKI